MSDILPEAVSTSDTPKQEKTQPQQSQQPRSQQKQEEDFSQHDEFCDVILNVEGRRLHTSRFLLASASPVWKNMFTSDFKEKNAVEIPLPGKKYEDIQEMLRCLYPGIQKPIDEKNVLQVLPLFDEYQVTLQKSKCEEWMVKHLEKLPLIDVYNDRCIDDKMSTALQYLVIAEQYQLELLMNSVAAILANKSMQDLIQCQEYFTSSLYMQNKVLSQRVEKLEYQQERFKLLDLSLQSSDPEMVHDKADSTGQSRMSLAHRVSCRKCGDNNKVIKNMVEKWQNLK